MKLLSGNQIKLIALIAMVCDHIGLLFLSLCPFLRCFGRISMPIFAYFIAEGCRYTKHKWRYFFTMFLSGMFFDIVTSILMKTPFRGIISQYALAIIIIYCFQYAKASLDKHNIIGFFLGFFTIIAIFTGNFFLSNVVTLEYYFIIIILPLFIYLVNNKYLKLVVLAIGIAFIIPLSILGLKTYCAYLSIPVLFLYNGLRGKWKMKYFFYIFYPAHMLILYGIAYLIIHF